MKTFYRSLGNLLKKVVYHSTKPLLCSETLGAQLCTCSWVMNFESCSCICCKCCQFHLMSPVMAFYESRLEFDFLVVVRVWCHVSNEGFVCPKGFYWGIPFRRLLHDSIFGFNNSCYSIDVVPLLRKHSKLHVFIIYYTVNYKNGLYN